MSFVIQRVTGRQISLSEVRASVLRIGRGTNAELRSDNPAVALEHAVIESDAAGYTITDKGSITGTYVNGKPVESARLAKGDVIEVGDLRIEVQVAEAKKPLFVRLVARPKTAAAAVSEDDEDDDVAPALAASGGAVRAAKIDYADAFRLRRVWLTKLSLVAIGLIVTLAVIAEVTRPQKQTAFMPGGITSAHARANQAAIAKDCHACHDPWNSVKDEKCTTCHQRMAHAVNEKDPLTCMACHTEHRGLPKLALVNDQKCASCHADLTPHVKVALASTSAIRSVTDFGKDHPELTHVADPNNIRFNHRLHLKKGGIFNASGRREELQCEGCHKLVVVRGKADPVKLEFEQHCQRCHKLTFDPRFPTAEIPHGGDPQLAYGYIATTYAGNRDIIGKSPAEVRRILTRRQNVAVDERAVINAAQVVKVKCGKCHDLQKKGELLAVEPPKLVTDWMPGSRFTHTKHSGQACESCHHDVRTSVATSDVHMPAKNDCTSCHGANANTNAASSCMTCHEYHVRSKPLLTAAATLPIAGGTSGSPGGKPRMIDTIVLITITVLVLVVLVPVGIALLQRLTRKDDRPAAPPAARPAPPPLQQQPPMPAPAPPPPAAAPIARAPEPPTAPISRAPQPAAPPPPPPAQFSTPADATRIGNLSDVQAAASAGGGTEMVEWYGMLLCTSGPTEGQRTIIEGDGVYIGRDASMAQIVINDSRVSKRHVRVMPRGGKVWAIDQGSTNGTFVGGQRITEVQLKRGDAIVLADNAATFTYQI
jgi:pSer/pThr/pTyr-binding forkhead associated (FHA) protein